MTELHTISDSLRRLAKEIWPSRKFHYDKVQFEDQTLLAVLYLQRKLDNKIDKLPPGYADGYKPQGNVGWQENEE